MSGDILHFYAANTF